MAARASAIRGMRVVYDKEGTDPGLCPEHHTPHFHQRRRQPLGRLHNRTGEGNADAHLKRQIMGREVVVAVTNGRLDGFAERSTELTPRARRNPWHVGTGLSRPDGMAGTGVLTGGGGSGCWQRSSGSSGTQCYRDV
jgi:hypothetical protein